MKSGSQPEASGGRKGRREREVEGGRKGREKKEVEGTCHQKKSRAVSSPLRVQPSYLRRHPLTVSISIKSNHRANRLANALIQYVVDDETLVQRCPDPGASVEDGRRDMDDFPCPALVEIVAYVDIQDAPNREAPKGWGNVRSHSVWVLEVPRSCSCDGEGFWKGGIQRSNAL